MRMPACSDCQEDLESLGNEFLYKGSRDGARDKTPEGVKTVLNIGQYALALHPTQRG